MSKALRWGMVGALMAGLLALPTAAAADDDRARRVDTCSSGAKYRMTLIEVDDDRYNDDVDRVRVKFRLNSEKADRQWRVGVRKNGNRVFVVHPTTGPRGNFVVNRAIRGEDDDYIRVRAVGPRGQICVRGFRIDPDD